MNNLYTIIIQFRAGIYVNQITSKNVKQAIIKWASTIDKNGIKYLGIKACEELRELSKTETPVLLQGIVKVWCISFNIKAGFIIGNVIMTAR